MSLFLSPTQPPPPPHYYYLVYYFLIIHLLRTPYLLTSSTIIIIKGCIAKFAAVKRISSFRPVFSSVGIFSYDCSRSNQSLNVPDFGLLLSSGQTTGLSTSSHIISFMTLPFTSYRDSITSPSHGDAYSGVPPRKVCPSANCTIPARRGSCDREKEARASMASSWVYGLFNL